MATTPNYKWPTPDDTARVKQGAAAMRSLGNAIDASVKALSNATDASLRNVVPATTIRATGNALRSLGGSGSWGFVQCPTVAWQNNISGVAHIDANGIVADIASFWVVDVQVTWNTNASAGTRRGLGIAQSTADTPNNYIAIQPAPAGSSSWQQHAVFMCYAAAGDRLGLFAMQDTGASLDIGTRSVSAARIW